MSTVTSISGNNDDDTCGLEDLHQLLELDDQSDVEKKDTLSLALSTHTKRTALKLGDLPDLF